MGLFDQLAGREPGKSGAQEQDADQASQSNLVSGVTKLINDAGGLSGLLQKFQESGLGDKVASWVGHGENQPVSGDEVKDGLGG